MLFVIASLALLQPPLAPDYVLMAGLPASSAKQTIYHHEGRFRSDDKQGDGQTASDYIAPGQRQQLVVVRKADGAPNMLFVNSDQTPPLAAEDPGWVATGQTRTLAGETCALYGPSAPAPPWTARCVTTDGVDLIFRGERVLEASQVQRRAVSDADVAPPLHLIALSAWLPASAATAPGHDAKGDYTATFGSGSRFAAIRRSGDWTIYEPAGYDARSTVVNETLGLEIKSSPNPKDGLVIRQFPPGQRFKGALNFKPGLFKGQTNQTIAGETCRWFERLTTPDFTELQCQTEDGAVLASGGRGMGSESMTAAIHFERAPVDVTTVMPPADRFTPERYGLR